MHVSNGIGVCFASYSASQATDFKNITTNKIVFIHTNTSLIDKLTDVCYEELCLSDMC